MIVSSSVGCSDTSAVFTVTMWSKPKVTASAAGPTEFCDPGSVTLNASDSAGFNYNGNFNSVIYSTQF